MTVIVVANPKGGVGKSTLATNIAGYLARQGKSVMLGDCDQQQSSKLWLSLRAASLPAITTWEIGDNNIAKPPKGTTHAVLDTPAGLHGWRYRDVLKLATHIIVPLQPSIFDIYATQAFMASLAEERAAKNINIAVVGMRVDGRTKAAEQLAAFCDKEKLPVLGYLRDTQNYIQLAARGFTIWDVAPSRVEKDTEQWQPILKWLNT
jgi:chromosome partitioning protein